MGRRYERASTVLTSNKGFEEWGLVLGDEVMAAALIDRVVHHCHIVNIRGNSYRMRAHQDLLQSASDSTPQEEPIVIAGKDQLGAGRPHPSPTSSTLSEPPRRYPALGYAAADDKPERLGQPSGGFQNDMPTNRSSIDSGVMSDSAQSSRQGPARVKRIGRAATTILNCPRSNGCSDGSSRSRGTFSGL